MSAGHPVTLEEFSAGYGDRYRNSDERVLFGIEILADGRLVGLVVLDSAEAGTGGAEAGTGDAEFDIYIGEKDCWGRGYGTEATWLICRYGFSEMPLHRISFWAADTNTAAIRVYEKVGFVEERRARDSLRHDGTWHDMILMGLLEGELRSRPSGLPGSG
jgi:RimJ/RimL family protein N-acetyltransferase